MSKIYVFQVRGERYEGDPKVNFSPLEKGWCIHRTRKWRRKVQFWHLRLLHGYMNRIGLEGYGLSKSKCDQLGIPLNWPKGPFPYCRAPWPSIGNAERLKTSISPRCSWAMLWWVNYFKRLEKQNKILVECGTGQIIVSIHDHKLFPLCPQALEIFWTLTKLQTENRTESQIK